VALHYLWDAVRIETRDNGKCIPAACYAKTLMLDINMFFSTYAQIQTCALTLLL